MTGAAYYFDTRDCADIAALCSHFTVKQLQSPTRSTVPLMDLVHNNQTEWNRLLEKLDVPVGCAVHFEFEVPSPKLRGNASQTDALFASASVLWAVEAKWTERRDRQTVTERISKPESDGADPRVTVNGWLTYLQRFASHPLRVDDFADVIYQMVHRAASAAYASAQRSRSPELVYLHFVPSPDPYSATTEHYIAELSRLHEGLGRPGNFPFRVAEMSLQYTSTFEAIKDMDKHSPVTSRQVREALCSGPLFTFGEAVVTQV